MESSISNYTAQELFEAFESVDDIAYPQRALALIRQIISITELSIAQIIEKYQSGHSLTQITTLLIIPDMSIDNARMNQQTMVKLNRLAKFL